MCVHSCKRVSWYYHSGESPIYIHHEDTHTPQYARSEYHTQLANMSFDEIIDLVAEANYFCVNKKG